MNCKKIIVIFLLLFAPTQSHTMSTLFVKPSTFFPQPRLATPCLTSLEVQFARAHANKSYNDFEQEVPLLTVHGPEDLLKRFIDPSLPETSTDKVGQALFFGKMTINELGLSFDKNLSNGWYLSIETSISDGHFHDFCPHPVDDRCRLLSQQDIDTNTELKEYLEIFHKDFLIKQGASHIRVYGLAPTYVMIGYAHNFQDFVHADFIDISVKGGISTPETDSNFEPSLVHLPLQGIKNIGFPFQASASIGFYDWLTLGGTGCIIPFMARYDTTTINPSKSSNVILSQHDEEVLIKQGTFSYISAFVQAEHLIPHLSLLAGISYAHKERAYYCADDAQRFPCDIINEHSLHKSWERACITLEAELDLGSESEKNMPLVKFLYVRPFHGRSVFKTSALAGQIGFQLVYEF